MLSPLHTDSVAPLFHLPVRNSASGQQAAALLDLPGIPGVPTSDGPLIGLPPMTTPLPAINKPNPPVNTTTTTPKPPAPPLTVGGDVQAAKIIKRVLPLYPQLAKQARVSGRVQLSGVIAKDGTVQKLQVISGPALLVKAAVDAVSQWIYRPTYLNGQPVEVIAPIDVIFTLQ